MIPINYYTPKINLSDVEDIQHKLYSITKRVYTKYEFKSKEYQAPFSAMIHPAALQDLVGYKTLLQVALTLTTALNDVSQNNIVRVSQAAIAFYTKLSLKTIINSLSELEDMGYIDHIGKQSYRLSAKLCFIGKPADWAIALHKLNSEARLGALEEHLNIQEPK